MDSLSTLNEWTFVFCSLAPEMRHVVWDVALGRGYGVSDYEWYKPDLKCKSISGGARQPYCSEHIVVVFKFNAGAPSHRNMETHFSLLLRKDTLSASGTVMVRFCSFCQPLSKL